MTNSFAWTREFSANAINTVLFLGLLVVAVIAYFMDEPFIISLVTLAIILAMAGMGLNIALGYGGLVSLGHAAFFGLGGYSVGILSSHAQDSTPIYDGLITVLGTQFMPIMWLVALVICGCMAFLIAILSLRVSGVYFIMVTLAFGQMLFYFATSWPTYGGEDGLAIYTRSNFPGLNTSDPIQFFAICYILLACILYYTARIRNAPFGLTLNAVRQSPARVETVGIRPFKVRLVSFVVSGMITGLAGALFADLNGFVSPDMLSWQTSGEIMIFVILGGVGRLFGPIAGASLFVFLEYVLGGLSDYWHVYLGILLLFIVLFAKGGVIGLLSGKSVSHD